MIVGSPIVNSQWPSNLIKIGGVHRRGEKISGFIFEHEDQPSSDPKEGAQYLST
jgi:hypothetical protein